MDKNKIIILSNYTKDTIKSFSKYSKNETVKSTFLDWTIQDVIGHIVFWVNYSKTQLINVKDNKQYDSIENLEKTNLTAYNVYKEKSFAEILQETDNSFNEYINLIELSNEEELNKTDYFPGVTLELWKCMLMDLFTHPIMHILHYYLKEEMYKEFAEEISNIGGDFLEYSNNDMNVFSFDEFYINSEEKQKHFTKLKKYSEGTNNELLRRIIQKNTDN